MPASAGRSVPQDATAAAAINAAAAVRSIAAKGLAFAMNTRPERVGLVLGVASDSQRSTGKQSCTDESRGQRDGHAVAVGAGRAAEACFGAAFWSHVVAHRLTDLHHDDGTSFWRLSEHQEHNPFIWNVDGHFL